MANDLILMGNKALANVQRSISVLNKLLPNSFDRLAWWNALSQDWKNLFFSVLEISEIAFNQKPDFYLEKLFNTTKLKIAQKQIQDISPLGNLTQLTYLRLAHNKIQDISPLAKLENLNKLELNGNPVTQSDIDWLQSKLPNCRITYY
ncbi:leucine-rich repeat domain-containing protein [Actinobacillus porcinus]|uniref:leucine-rich repeat domain-containing protein n=1 Tax=Actinobacillus porcinus TaxID=51048 RepID=UPI002355EAE0|nr:leucine-rich repeat domain-containing protein [Actinobacillus porcinus]